MSVIARESLLIRRVHNTLINGEMNQVSKDTWLFIAIAFAWSWLLWLPQVLASAGWLDLSGAASSVLGTLALFGPRFAAFISLGRRKGQREARGLWTRSWDWRFDKC